MVFGLGKSAARRAYEKEWANDEEAAPGWDAIDRRLEAILGDKKPDRHLATDITQRVAFGGPEILDGISLYLLREPVDHWLIVTYGLSELYYAPESAGEEFSKYGFELTMRVLQQAGAPEEEPAWAVNVLRNLANYVHRYRKILDHGHRMSAGGPIRLGSDTALTAFVIVDDPKLGKIETPHGSVQFLEVVGITANEISAMQAEPSIDENLAQRFDPRYELGITDLSRDES